MQQGVGDALVVPGDTTAAAGGWHTPVSVLRNALLAENRGLARRHNTTGDYLLRALVSCGVCGYACTGRQEPPRYAY
jgi:hypothetical protein